MEPRDAISVLGTEKPKTTMKASRTVKAEVEKEIISEVEESDDGGSEDDYVGKPVSSRSKQRVVRVLIRLNTECFSHHPNVPSYTMTRPKILKQILTSPRLNDRDGLSITVASLSSLKLPRRILLRSINDRTQNLTLLLRSVRGRVHQVLRTILSVSTVWAS